jgi:hypothetical protein
VNTTLLCELLQVPLDRSGGDTGKPCLDFHRGEGQILQQADDVSESFLSIHESKQ